MTSNGPEIPPGAWAEPSPWMAFVNESLAIAQVELRKLLRDPTELFSRALQPVLWLAIFGQVMARAKGIQTGALSYLDFMAPGILAQSVLFSAIFYGIGVIWERDLGVVHKMLVSPASRLALVFGKAVSAGFRGLVQAVILYLLAFCMGVTIRWEFFPILGVMGGVVLGSAIFSTFSLMIACVVKTRERFMGIGQVMTMPLFFASNAIYPLSLMPGWLRVLAELNPLTYLVDALRELMIQGGESVHGLGTDFGAMAFVLVVFLTIGSKLYPTLVR